MALHFSASMGSFTRSAARAAALTAFTAPTTGSAQALAATPPAATTVGGGTACKRHRRALHQVSRAESAENKDAQCLDAEAPAAPAIKPARLQATKSDRSGPTRCLEEELWQQGYLRVAGVDEAGRGPLAGPVVAAACIVPLQLSLPGVDDSKKLGPEQREALYQQLTCHPDVLWAAHVVDVEEIDRINILQAALKAMEGSVAALAAGPRGLQGPDFLLVDGNRLPKAFDPQRSKAVVRGDSTCVCIAAASIIAKVTRDRLMEVLHGQYPQYNFAGHKGYGVPEHIEAIRLHGPCPAHRRSFAPVKHWFPSGAAADREPEAPEKKPCHGESGSNQPSTGGGADGGLGAAAVGNDGLPQKTGRGRPRQLQMQRSKRVLLTR